MASSTSCSRTKPSPSRTSSMWTEAPGPPTTSGQSTPPWWPQVSAAECSWEDLICCDIPINHSLLFHPPLTTTLSIFSFSLTIYHTLLPLTMYALHYVRSSLCTLFTSHSFSLSTLHPKSPLKHPFLSTPPPPPRNGLKDPSKHDEQVSADAGHLVCHFTFRDAQMPKHDDGFLGQEAQTRPQLHPG